MTAPTGVTAVPRRYPGLVFLALAAAAILSARLLNTTWEWDSLTRAEIARYLDEGGLHWYFFEAKKCVWLPLWPMLTAAVHRVTGLPYLLAAETLNAVAESVLGETKEDVDRMRIDEEWEEDSERVVSYCVKDALLALKILKRILRNRNP